jgi:hypothetical protein
MGRVFATGHIDKEGQRRLAVSRRLRDTRLDTAVRWWQG